MFRGSPSSDAQGQKNGDVNLFFNCVCVCVTASVPMLCTAHMLCAVCL